MKIVRAFWKIVVNLTIRFCGLFIPKNDHFLLFGSWLGDSYSDNSRYLFEYLINTENEFKLIWVGKAHLQELMPKSDKVIFCRINSLKSIFYILRSKYAFVSQGILDLFDTNIFNRICIVYLSHGAALKKWGEDDPSETIIRRKGIRQILSSFYLRILGGWPQYRFCVVTSPLHGNCLRSAIAFLGGRTAILIPSGYPRNDLLLQASHHKKKEIKEIYARKLGFSTQKKVVLYVPTFRRTHTKIESFCYRSPEEIKRIKSVLQKNNAVLIEKNHYATYANNKFCSGCVTEKDLVYLNKEENLAVNIQELLLVVDVLISDYSSILFDFVLLDKPSICFAYDYEYYKNIDSGLYYEIGDYSTGRVTRSFEETCEELEQLLIGVDDYAGKRKYVREKYMPYDQGHASETIISTVVTEVKR